MSTGALYVVATPIGNLADISLRALETLRMVDSVVAEDTRHTRKLLSYYHIHKPLISYHSQNIEKRGPELIKRLLAGADLALVTDAGTPGISDPGVMLIRQVLNNGLKVVHVPGPAALIAALVVSGLPTQPFAFLGFPPNRGAGRKRFFESHGKLSMTLILYESPHRLQQTLAEIAAIWGNRQLVVARELTKKFEEIYRGTVVDAQQHFAPPVKGEITLVVAGAEQDENSPNGYTAWTEELQQLLQQGKTVKESADMISVKFAVGRRRVYQEALRQKSPADSKYKPCETDDVHD